MDGIEVDLSCRKTKSGTRQQDWRVFCQASQDLRHTLLLTSRALRLRRQHYGLFQQGTYLPCKVTGERRDNLFALMRQYQGLAIMVVVPRLLAELLQPHRLPINPAVWRETAISIPDGIPDE